MIKDEVNKLKPSSTLLINEESKKLEKEGKRIFKFGFGQSPFDIPKSITAELKNNSHQNKYLPMQGLLELRKAVAKYTSKKKNYKYKDENVIIGPGTKELMFLLNILFEGDIILPAPSWVSYEPQAILGRNKVHWINTKIENNWFPTADEIEKIITQNKEKNYLLFINSPNNPSGQICKNLKEIALIVKKYKVIVLSDEIYSELSFNKDFKSISEFCPEKTIISTGLSKWCAAGGWRLGHFIIPDNLNEIKIKLSVLASETFSSVSSPVQYAAISAYEKDHSNYINICNNILKSIGEYVYSNLKSNNVIVNKPEGGFYIMPEFLNKNFTSSSEMCKNLLEKTGVALLPGSNFGISKNKMIARLSFTDFNGESFMQQVNKSKDIDFNIISKYAPNIIEGTKRLKEWAESAK